MKKLEEMQNNVESKKEENGKIAPKLSLVELKALVYDLAVQKQQIDLQIQQVNSQIAEEIKKNKK